MIIQATCVFSTPKVFRVAKKCNFLTPLLAGIAGLIFPQGLLPKPFLY